MSAHGQHDPAREHTAWPSEWWADPSHLAEFLDWLDDRGYFAEPADVIRAVSEPWSWSDEYVAYRAEVGE